MASIEKIEQEEGLELTYGQRAVGLKFNPGGNPLVDDIKYSYANIIDNLDKLRSETEDMEVIRMLSIAITEVQTSQMWAVKAVTWKS